MAKQLKLTVQFLVNNAMAAMLELGTGTLSQHVECAFNDYITRYNLSVDDTTVREVLEQLNDLGFKW